MGKKDPRVDAYIAKAADFAKPILRHLREQIHAACPDVEEGIKWGFPHFMCRGILCSMASFKQHCAFGFWHKAMHGSAESQGKCDEAMGQFGRITSLADLPDRKSFARLVKRAMELNESGVKPPKPARPKARKPLVVPDDLVAALRKNEKARETFEGFSYSHQKEYVEWIGEAKREETRQKRLQATLEWLSAGKPRNWKYERCGDK